MGGRVERRAIKGEKMKKIFKKKLEELLNKYSIDNDCKTPDYILAEYLCDCIGGYRKTVDAMREKVKPHLDMPYSILPPETPEQRLYGFNPPPENAKLPEKPTPVPLPKTNISHMVGE